ncbi:MAG: toll/interleukin-1 receptor domain-containing protein [bacterium]|nr:toll/interleukin-1 receptor domain-containing protein [bacterium]
MSSPAATERFWDRLLGDVEEPGVIPIIGEDLPSIRTDAGDSTLYPVLAKLLAEYLGQETDDLPAGGELNAVTRRYLESGTRDDPHEIEDVYKGINKIVREQQFEPSETLRKLAEIRALKLFVKTTFDLQLAHAISQVRYSKDRYSEEDKLTKVEAYSPESSVDLGCRWEKLERETVFHLFGKLSAVPYEYVVTEEDTLEFMYALQDENKGPKALFHELSRRPLLLIGSTFPDWLTRFFLRAATGERLSSEQSNVKVFVNTSDRRDPRLRAFLSDIGARTRFYEGGDPAEFVAELHRRWIERHPQKVNATGDQKAAAGGSSDMKEGSIFLSYASEDRNATTKIRDALEAAGLDVWFDRDDLPPGSKFKPEIKYNIERCALFLPVLSNTLTIGDRRFVRREWKIAAEVAMDAPDSAKFIMPIAIEDVPPNSEYIDKAIRDCNWEWAPGGQVSTKFVDQVVEAYREYQKNSRETA